MTAIAPWIRLRPWIRIPSKPPFLFFQFVFLKSKLFWNVSFLARVSGKKKVLTLFCVIRLDQIFSIERHYSYKSLLNTENVSELGKKQGGTKDVVWRVHGWPARTKDFIPTWKLLIETNLIVFCLKNIVFICCNTLDFFTLNRLDHWKVWKSFYF